MRYHYILIRITKIKNNSATPNVGKNAKKLDHSHIDDGNVKRPNHSGKQFHNFL